MSDDKNKIVPQITSSLITADYIIHVLAAILLLVASLGVFLQALSNLNGLTQKNILMLINNALLILIIKEILWTVVKFFRKQAFSISNFLFIGVITSIRNILLVEVQKSVAHVPPMEVAMETLASAVTIFILVVSYYVFNKARNLRKTEIPEM